MTNPNFIFLSATPDEDNTCYVPASDYNSACAIARKIGATGICVNGREVSGAVRRGDRMLVFFRVHFTQG